MNRITITIDDDLTSRLDQHMAAHGYTNRSEAMRDLARESLTRHAAADAGATYAVAILSFVFDIETRDLPKRLMHAQHEHHDLAVATTYVALDHQLSLGLLVLRGPLRVVQTFSDSLLTQRGISHGALHLIPVAPSHSHKHVYGDHTEGKPHVHLKTIV